jgi:ubiquinone/menaquinone biosynthesis C-methylase UbiE
MLPEDLEHYLSEISRVLKKNGRCLITFFLLNKESLASINSNTSTQKFIYDFGKYRAIDRNVQECAVCYNEQYILGIYRKAGLCISKRCYGAWRKRKTSLDYQDIIIAKKL